MLEPFICKSHVFCLVVCFHFVVCCLFTLVCPAAEGSCPQLHVCLEGPRTLRLQSSCELCWTGGLMKPSRLPSGNGRLWNAWYGKHKMDTGCLQYTENTNISVNWNILKSVDCVLGTFTTLLVLDNITIHNICTLCVHELWLTGHNSTCLTTYLYFLIRFKC